MTRLQAIICGTTHSRSLADGRRDQDHQPRRAGQASRAVFADRTREGRERAGVHRGAARLRQGREHRRRGRLRRAVRSGLRERRGGAQGRRRRLSQRGAIHDLSRALSGRAEIQGVPAARVSPVLSERGLPAEHAGDGRPPGGRAVSAGSPDGGGALRRRAMIRYRCAWLAVCSVLLCAAGGAAAQSYPQRPVRLIIPAPAGGPTDVPGRLIADGLSGLLGQRFVVENRVGAGGLLAGEFVARSEPNGYTLLYANTSVLAVNPALQGSNMPYDPATAFAPIGFVSNSPQLLVANPKLPYRSVQELVAWAKSNPGKLNFATAGVGTLPHLTYELFRMETGIQALNVPYAGGAPALTAVIAGQADVLFDLMRTRIRSGKLRALAITGASRDPELPDIPTLAESGYPAVTSTSGTGIVARLNSKLNELIELPETQAKMKSFGLVPRSGPPEEFGAWAAQERQRWTRVVKESGAKAD